MTGMAVAFTVLFPIVLAGLLAGVDRRFPDAARIINLAGVSILFAAVAVLLFSPVGNTPVVVELGNWPAPFGIVWVFDRLSGLMLMLTSSVALMALLYAIKTGEDKRGPHFHALFQAQLFGLNGAFLTGDLFNLFVFLEVLLLASYGLLLHGGGKFRTRGGLHYVIINLVGSTLFLFAVGTLYGVVGTLNIADLALKLPDVPADRVPLVVAAFFLLFTVFLIKAAAFPLYLWLPGAYAYAPVPIAALFAIMTKIGLYAILRVDSAILADNYIGPLPSHDLITPWLLWLGLITLLFAAIGVMAARFMRGQVAYLIIASVGTILIALGIDGSTRDVAVSGALYYWIHTTILSAGMFLLAGWIMQNRPQQGDTIEPAPPMPNPILIGGLFFAYAIAMAGLPPLTGFIGKVMILFAAVDNPMTVPVFAAILFSSLLLIVALARTGSVIFYQTRVPAAKQTGDGNDNPNFSAQEGNTFLPKGPISYAVYLPMALTAAMVIFANPVTQWLDNTALQIADRQAYVDAVMPDGILDPEDFIEPGYELDYLED